MPRVAGSLSVCFDVTLAAGRGQHDVVLRDLGLVSPSAGPGKRTAFQDDHVIMYAYYLFN